MSSALRNLGRQITPSQSHGVCLRSSLAYVSARLGQINNMMQRPTRAECGTLTGLPAINGVAFTNLREVLGADRRALGESREAVSRVV